MKNKIKEVQDYFVNKIVDGDFEIVGLVGYCGEIRVDDIYTFTLWLGNGSDCIRTYEHQESFMGLKFTDKQKPKVFGYFETLKERKNREYQLEKFNRLKKELGL